MNLNAILIIFFLLSAIWWLFAWLYYDYRLDLLRYRLFLERDKLFLLAAEGKFGFDEAAYLMTRRSLNGALRFAHRLTLTKLIITALWLRRYKPNGGIQYRNDLKQAMQKLSLEQKKIILEAHLNLHYALITHVAHVSPFFFPVTIVFKIGLYLHFWSSRTLSRKAKAEMESIDAHVFELGLQV